jgi:phage terminase Nu1 subunit (DNA packaging protein)
MKKSLDVSTTKKRAHGPLVVDLQTFAGLCGRSRSTLNTWLLSGMPTGGRGGSHGAHRIEVGPALKWLLDRAEVDAQEARDIANADPATAEALAAARLSKLRHESRLLELDVAEREGALVPAGDIEASWGRIVAAIKEGVLSIAAVAVQAGLVTPEHELELDTLCRDVLRDLATKGEQEAISG